MTIEQFSLSYIGKLKQYASLFFPFLFMGFSSTLYLLIEKVLLARLSIEEVEVAVTVAYICQIFQITCIALALMSQISVARWFGEQNWKAIGPGIWQFIWFSFLSILIVVPIGIVYGNFFLKQISIKELALPYFYFFLWMNFLFPLGTALSCFYLGQGKIRLVLFATIGCHLLKIILAVPLILGWGWIPSLGLIGGAISTFIAQGALCVLLFYLFIKPENQEKFHARVWNFDPKLFWDCIRPGLLRAINRILTVASWAAVVYIVSAKGDDYLLVLSLGGAFSIFLPFVGDAICQTGTIIASQMIGARKYHLLGKVTSLGFSFGVIFILLGAIPLLLCPNFTFECLFPKAEVNTITIHRIMLGVWISFVFHILSCLTLSYVFAFKDMYFSLFMGFFNWFNGFLIMYVALEKFAIAADLFWIAHSFMHITTALVYFLRSRKLCSPRFLAQYERKDSIPATT